MVLVVYCSLRTGCSVVCLVCCVLFVVVCGSVCRVLLVADCCLVCVVCCVLRVVLCYVRNVWWLLIDVCCLSLVV